MTVTDGARRPAQIDHVSPAPQPARTASRSAGLFRAFWRWHFYGAAVVVPVLLVLAVTGLVYLFRFQVEPLLHPTLMRVDAQPGVLMAKYETQRGAVAEALPGATVVAMTEPGAPDETTRFTVTTPAGQTRDVFVDPYDATVLGSLDPDTTLSGTAVRLHADLMAGRVGDIVMELGACWAIVMTLTGYYLFVRGRKGRARQRRAAGPGARLRTTHARVGLFVGAGLLLLVVSGLPWTGVWGAQAQRLVAAGGSSFWSEDHGALSNPTSTLDESLPHSHHVVPWAQEKSGVPSSAEPGDEVSVASLDTAVAVAERDGLAQALHRRPARRRRGRLLGHRLRVQRPRP